MSGLRLLLLQARRADDPMLVQERAVFVRRTRLPSERIVPHDLLSGPPPLSRLAGFDALLMGGSGEYLVSARDLPRIDATLGFLAAVVERGFPMFASCFGFQCLVAAAGGEIVHDPAAAEVGTLEVELTEAGRADPLLGPLPARFPAQMGRKDRARRLPSGFIHLARSARSPYQAFRIGAAPQWGTQFHPELSGEENRERYQSYLDRYELHLAPEERATALERFRPSPDVEPLLRRFLALVFGQVR